MEKIKRKKITKLDKEIIDEWIINHGACTFDSENLDIILHDGGLFSIEKEKIMLPKIIGRKKIPNGMTQILFSKKKYPAERTFARLWIKDIDSTIRYFVSMKKMFNKIGIATNFINKK